MAAAVAVLVGACSDDQPSLADEVRSDPMATVAPEGTSEVTRSVVGDGSASHTDAWMRRVLHTGPGHDPVAVVHELAGVAADGGWNVQPSTYEGAFSGRREAADGRQLRLMVAASGGLVPDAGADIVVSVDAWPAPPG